MREEMQRLGKAVAHNGQFLGNDICAYTERNTIHHRDLILSELDHMERLIKRVREAIDKSEKLLQEAVNRR